MLVRFNVGNFLSFKEVQEFSLIKGRTEDKNKRIYETDKIKFLKFASLFGANGSGKSNFVSSMMCAKNIILDGKYIPSLEDMIYSPKKIYSFKLDETYKEKPSYFEFEIIIDNNNYSYGFEILLNKKEFISEWLIELNPDGNKVIFERDIKNGKFTSSLKITNEKIKNKFEVYSDDIKNDNSVLFLGNMNNSKDEIYKDENELGIFKKVYKWFKNILTVNFCERDVSKYSYFKDSKNKEEICKLIKSLGTGITNFLEYKLPEEELNSGLLRLITEDLNLSSIIDLKDKNFTSIIRWDKKLYVISLDDDEKPELTTIVFNHGNETIFQFEEESDGTRRILDLIEILLTTEEKVFVIDEIDRSLHPQLTYKFISEFLKIAEKRNIQLIITSHESHLLDFNLLRQDEVWIANKDNTGATELYSLNEYNVTFSKQLEKAYLEGRYGGVPIFSTLFPMSEGE